MSVTRIGPGRYRVRVVNKAAGRDHRIVVNGPRQLAEELEARIIQNRIRARYGLEIERPRVVFSDHWEDWVGRLSRGLVGRRIPSQRTVQIFTDRYRHLRVLHDEWIDQISRERLEAALAFCPSPDAAYKACALARRLISDAQERGIAVDPSALATRIARPSTSRQGRALTWDEVIELSAWLPDHISRAAPFLGLTGLRVSEFCALDDSTVGDGFVDVRASKTAAGVRRVYLCRHAATLVAEQKLARPAGSTLLFPTSLGTPYNKGSFCRILQRAAGRAGLGHLTPHDLRRTAMTLLAQAGVDAMLAKEQLGWSDATFAAMLPLYRRVAGWELPRAVGRLDEMIEGSVDGGTKVASH